jgi:hypothetical protein
MPTDADLIEAVAADVHAAWIEAKKAQGITSRPSSDGIEQMVPYAELPDHLKELDRATVRAVLESPTLRARLSGGRDTTEAADTIREWAAPDRGLGWPGCPDVGRHADQIAAFLNNRRLLR